MMQEVKMRQDPELMVNNSLFVLDRMKNSKYLNSIENEWHEAEFYQHLDVMFHRDKFGGMAPSRLLVDTDSRSDFNDGVVGVNKEGWVELPDGSRLSYKYIWDNRERLYDLKLAESDINFQDEKEDFHMSDEDRAELVNLETLKSKGEIDPQEYADKKYKLEELTLTWSVQMHIIKTKNPLL